MWRPDFAHAEARPATVAGWARRFWQGSTDHRGVPGAPGRVVTLVEEPGALCHGRAYRVDSGDRDAVIARLDYREKGGYALREADILLAGSGVRVTGLIYIATAGNPNWLGCAAIPDIARQVRGAAGPSGTNVEYVVELARTLRDMGADDSHVFALADRLSGSGDRRSQRVPAAAPGLHRGRRFTILGSGRSLRHPQEEKPK